MATRQLKPASPSDEILHLKGKDAKKFLEYDRRELTVEEKDSLQKAREYYKVHCKD